MVVLFFIIKGIVHWNLYWVLVWFIQCPKKTPSPPLPHPYPKTEMLSLRYNISEQKWEKLEIGQNYGSFKKLKFIVTLHLASKTVEIWGRVVELQGLKVFIVANLVNNFCFFGTLNTFFLKTKEVNFFAL